MVRTWMLLVMLAGCGGGDDDVEPLPDAALPPVAFNPAGSWLVTSSDEACGHINALDFDEAVTVHYTTGPALRSGYSVSTDSVTLLHVKGRTFGAADEFSYLDPVTFDVQPGAAMSGQFRVHATCDGCTDCDAVLTARRL